MFKKAKRPTQTDNASIIVETDNVKDLLVNDFGLKDDTLQQVFGEHFSEIKLLENGKTQINWYKPDGTPQKSEPAAVKKKFAAALKQWKETAKNIQQTFSEQRQRFDQFYRENKNISFPHFQRYFIEHEIIKYLTRKLIWQFENDNKTFSGFFFGKTWRNERNEIAPDWLTAPETRVTLWHPVGKSVAEIVAWRDLLTEFELKQPFKQAFREIYLLTDAELQTQTYSNRMAAHIIRQPQFSALTRLRGWKYGALGVWSYDRQAIAKIEIPAFKIRAEFWLSDLYTDELFTEENLFSYIGTDQVRFYSTQTKELLPLKAVPPLIFSEVMRDIDLFVGVCSIGNDPNWQDASHERPRRFDAYWQRYSFGDLGEAAKVRKQVLEKILPRLKIASVAEIKDRFLIIKGKYRTYKIHIGSTNILMSPNDQYLCIVPDRKEGVAENPIYLPFEGDNALSVILSKAFLLANDDQITDATILHQIGFSK